MSLRSFAALRARYLTSGGLAAWLRSLSPAVMALSLIACSSSDSSGDHAPAIDGSATDRTQALLYNLHQLKGEGFLFGHQDSLAYGVEWWAEPNRSDVKAVTGDYPALYGWDIGHLESGDSHNIDDVNFQSMQGWMREGYERGGVITISWHMRHPATGEDSWNTDVGAAELLPEGEHHGKLTAALDRFAAFLEPLQATDEQGDSYPIPIIFRPWHEHNGNWFWWGRGPTTEAEYIALWRFTVEYLRDEKGLNHLLYAFSPDRSRIDRDNFDEGYLYAYPGDDYVDILGIDNYWDLGHSSNDESPEQNVRDFIGSLEGLARIAQQRGKLPAMTEGGQDTLFEEQFWSERILPGLLANEWTRQIAYIQVWRNANREKEQREHFYVPYSGHPGEVDFIEFYRHPASLFEGDLPAMYER